MPIPSQTLKDQRARAMEIFLRLQRAYPDVQCTLGYQSPFQLLIMTILAAQCTDARVNIVAQSLFKKFPAPRDFLRVSIAEIETEIKSTGFYRNKAKNIAQTCQILVDQFGGEVPRTMDELTKLPGVGRKTANVVLGECFGHQGIIVDTHCTRLANRLGFTRLQDAHKIEQALMKIWPREHWTQFSHYMVFHGRAICNARTPKCSRCVLKDICPYPTSREGIKCAR